MRCELPQRFPKIYTVLNPTIVFTGILGTAKGEGNRGFAFIRERKRRLMPLTSMNCPPPQVTHQNPDPKGQRIPVGRWEEAAFPVSLGRLRPGQDIKSDCTHDLDDLSSTGGRLLRRFIRR